ncbi:hypothetical protein [Plantactinospora sonchi]|uniref:Gram-positive cocci surface proteins LPxTG domain-containing protein n=1 Tax=Plantactinospora sonchi TaxID=1544735 RepID=A0ABU7RVH0_9ACTN
MLLGALLTAIVVTDSATASGDRPYARPGPLPIAAPASQDPGTVTFEVLPRPTAPPTAPPTPGPTPTGHLPVTEGAPPPGWLPLLGLALLLTGTVALLVARRRPRRD